MITTCKTYLAHVLKDLVGINVISYTRGDHRATREARIYTMPTRNKIALDFDDPRRIAYRYRDPLDTGTVRASGTTDTTGNTTTTVKKTGATFVTSGVVAGDGFQNRTDKTFAKVATVVSETELTLDRAAGGNLKAFEICSKTGTPKIKYRIRHSDFSVTFVVELTHKTLIEVETDFLNTIRNLSKFIYDGQKAIYVNEAGEVVDDVKGNKIQLSLDPMELNDNKFYGELLNLIIFEVRFDGAIFTPVDPTSSEITIPADWVVPIEGIINT